MPLLAIPLIELLAAAVTAVVATKALPERVSVDIQFRK